MSEESEVVSSAKPRSVHSKMAKPKNPKYTEMVEEAIKYYNEKGGSSRQAILKYITGEYFVGENAKYQVKLALVKSVGKGRLVQTKGVGASGSFKLSKEVKEEAKKEEKKRLKREKKALKDKENTAPENGDGEERDSIAKKAKKQSKQNSEKKEKKKENAATKKTKNGKEKASKDVKEKKSKGKKSKGEAKTEEAVKEKKRKKPSAKAKTSKIK